MIDLKIHIVQKGDTLWEIAKQYGVDFEEIKQLNSQLSSPDMIMPGMKVKIPSSTKAVKKESMKPKEEQKPNVKKPYKETSPKPVPMIKEDDHKKPKEVKVEMPNKMMPQVPEKPLQPMPQTPQVPEIPQMPMQQVIEQEQYTTINFPEMPVYPKPMEEMPEKEQPIPTPLPQPMPMPQPQQQVQVVPVCCCHMVQPCCHGMHHGPNPMGQMHGGFEPQYQHPMHHQQMMHPNNVENVNQPHPSPCMETPMQFQHQQHQHPMHDQQMMPPNQFGDMNQGWASPNWEMPLKPMQPGNEEDCGCHSNLVQPPHPMGHHMPPFPTQEVQQYPAYPEFAQQMQPDHLYPPQFREAQPQTNDIYPTPPGFSDYNNQENADESKGE